MSTREKLLSAAAHALAADGVASVSARSIAARAHVNQALIFYHFGSVADLLDAAVRWSVDEAVEDYRHRLRDITSLSDLLALGKALHAAEKARGNVAQMTQVLAGAQHDAKLAAAATYAIETWSAEVEAVIARVLDASPLHGLLDAGGMARAVTAGFIGFQLYEGVNPDGAATAIDALAILGAFAQSLDALGPVATKALRNRVRKAVPASRSARS